MHTALGDAAERTASDTISSSSGTSTTHGVANGTSQVASQGQSWRAAISAAPLGLGVSGSVGVWHSDGGSIGLADGVSQSIADSTTHMQMSGHAHTEATTTSVADDTSRSASRGESVSTSHAVSTMELEAQGTSLSNTRSYAHGVGSSQADTRSASVFGSQGSADSIGMSRSQALSAAFSSGMAELSSIVRGLRSLLLRTPQMRIQNHFPNRGPACQQHR